MLELREGELPRAEDGTRLLFYDEIAALAGTKTTTIRFYNAQAGRARRAGREAHFPAPARHVRRPVRREDGQRMIRVTPVWREDVIIHWNDHRLGPGGRPRSTLHQRAG